MTRTVSSQEDFADLVADQIRTASLEVCRDNTLIERINWVFGKHPHFEKARGYAVVYEYPDDWCRIVFSRKMIGCPWERAVGVIRHEIGHAVSYIIDTKDLNKWAWARGHSLPPENLAELRADALAEAIWNEPIHYDELLVQTTGRGIRHRPFVLGW